MIPQFPDFVKLDPLYKNHIEEITKKFPPYSDHNFTSLIMWDINSETEFSILNNNLVIKFKDYESDKKFYSFIGNNNIENTIEQLIEFSKLQGQGSEILLLPKDNFTHEQVQGLSKKYDLTEDRDNFDYILDVNQLADFAGGQYLNKRNKLNKFLKTYQPHVVINHLQDPDFQQELIDAFNYWVETTIVNRDKAFVNYDEIKAFKRLIEHHQYFDIFAVAVYIDGKIIGFSLFEIINSDYAHHPIQKGDIRYKGIYEFLYNTLGKYLKENGIKYLNIYQDLGHEGLRKAKMDYNPTFLKKYSISKRSADKDYS